MRCILPAVTVSLLLWYGIVQAALVGSDHLAPKLIPTAKHEVHEIVRLAEGALHWRG